MSHHLALQLVTPLCLLVSVTMVGVGSAADFSVESKIVYGTVQEATSRNLTIFHSGKVYDFLEDTPSEVIIIDSQSQDIILLDQQRRIKTELRHPELVAMCQAMLKVVHTAPVQIREMAFPNFESKFRSTDNHLTLLGKVLRYDVVGHDAENKDVLNQYRSFADSCARLNGVLHGRPPQARLELNASLVRHRILPKTIKLAIDDRSMFKATSYHTFQHTLSHQYLRRINDVEENVQDFRAVGLKLYQLPPAELSSGVYRWQIDATLRTNDHRLRKNEFSVQNRS